MVRQRFAACVLSAVITLGCMQGAAPVQAQEERGTLHLNRFESYAEIEAAAEGRFTLAGEPSASDAVLPERFDLRERGLVSSVKSQGSYGTCWTFSAMSSLESTLIARQPQIDLSEWHLAYYAYSPLFGYPQKDAVDTEDIFKLGGNFHIMSSMLTSWVGPVSESLYPYKDFSVLDDTLTREQVQAQAEYHISDANMFSYDKDSESFDAQLTAVKEALMDGHAVSVSYYNRSACLNGTAYYYDQDAISGGNYHAVTIVGWDDSYTADHFKTDPGMDGAWLIKNSWGCGWGDQGYFWISYADPTLLEVYYLEAESLREHDAMYLHDDYGYWLAFSVESKETSAYAANVFTAQKDTLLTSVMFCNAMPDENYSIRIYKNPTRSSDPTSGTAMGTTEGMVRTGGFHTVDLKEPVMLQEGDRFSIVIKFSGSQGQHLTCEAYSLNTVTRADGSVTQEGTMLSEEMLRRDFSAGESFYSSNGRRWYDMYDEEPADVTYTVSDGDGTAQVHSYAVFGNLCIRGLTQDVNTVIFSDDSGAVPEGERITLTSPGADEIFCAVDGGSYVLYTEPIVMGSEPLRLSAYAVTDGTAGSVYTQQYHVEKAQLSSLLCITNSKTSYADFIPTGSNTYAAALHLTAAPDTLSLQAICTGEALCGETALPSGKVTQVQWEGDCLTIYVTDEGMTDSIYRLYAGEIPLQEQTLGDVDLDGEVNALDAAEVLVYAAEVGSGIPVSRDEAWLWRADYDGNGSADALDAAAILVYAAQTGAGL